MPCQPHGGGVFRPALVPPSASNGGRMVAAGADFPCGDQGLDSS